MIDPDELRASLREMRELIESDPAVKSRFDTDGNGVIDGFEWDQVRQLVTARLEREAAEAAESMRAEFEARPLQKSGGAKLRLADPRLRPALARFALVRGILFKEADLRGRQAQRPRKPQMPVSLKRGNASARRAADKALL